MKSILLSSALFFSSFSAFSAEKIKCSMNLLGEEMFFSVIDLDKSKALIGYSGETVEEAVDEFELKLQKTNGDTLTFYADKATPYPGSMILEVNLKTMTQKAIFNSEGDELKFSGECTKI